MIEKSKTYIAIPPGVTIKEQLQDRGITQKEFAKRIGFSEKHVSKLINGEVQLTVEVARKLEMVLSIPAQFWCNLESIYREDLLKVKEENEFQNDLKIIKEIPYNQLMKLGWIEPNKNKMEIVIHLRKYFEVAQLSYLERGLYPQILNKKIFNNNQHNYSVLAWIQKAKLEARYMVVEKINVDKLKVKLNEFKNLIKENPVDFCPLLADELAKCGIALIYLSQITEMNECAVSFIDNKKIILGIVVEDKFKDEFWFSLFREFYYIIYGQSDNEDKINKFIRNIFISNDKYFSFVNKKDLSEESIIQFANNNEIDKGIIVRLLQDDKYIPSKMYNHLKNKYVLN